MRNILGILLMWISLISCQNTGYFWHVTDMHWDPTYKNDTPAGSCSNAPQGRTWGQYGDYLCDSPWDLIDSAIRAMGKIKPESDELDFLIWTGDDTPHIYNNTYLNQGKVLEIISDITDLLQEVFPNTVVYSALGNHDWSPKSQLPPRPDPFYDRIAEKWSNWITETQAGDTFKKGGYYTLDIEGTNVDAVVLNTNLYYTSNNEVDGTGDPAGQFQWLDDLLTAKAQQNRKVLIVTHIAPGMFERHRSRYWLYPESNVRLSEMLIKHSSVIGSMYTGHHHTDSFKILYNEKAQPVSSILIGPSITPWSNQMENFIGSRANNPSIRLVKYDRDTGSALDIEQYYLNLAEANLNGHAEWVPEYKGSEYYGQPDMSTPSLHEIATSFLDDSDMFNKYYTANGVSYNTSEICGGECKYVLYCSATKVDYTEYENCMQSLINGSLLQQGHKMGILLLVTLTMILLKCKY